MKRDQKLQDIIKVIASKAKPEKIYLFGSRARNKHNKESDYDILVIKDTKVSSYKRVLDIYKFFKQRNFSMDILVHTPKEIKYWADTPSSFIHHILQTGKLVYEK